MKKTLAALAVLGAFAGSAFAANVTLYGLVDTGFSYYHTDKGGNTDADDQFVMSTGANSASRFGLKGVEELGNGLKVGFVLENGFDSDDGQLGNDNRLFGREALVYVDGSFGQLGMGRVGQLQSGNGTYGIFGGKVAPMSSGWDKIAGHKYVMTGGFGRLDNTVTYKTPTFAGFNAYAQYSFETDSVKDRATTAVEGESSVNREYAVAVTYAAGPMYLAGIVTQTNVASFPNNPDAEDPLMFALGGHYNFGVLKAYAAAQYFQDSKLTVGAINDAKDAAAVAQKGYAYDGFGLHLGADVPAFGGTVKVGMGYMDAEDQTTAGLDMQRYTFALGYEYPLSKRTFVYGGAGYYQDSYDKAGADDASVTAVNMGLVHKF